MRIYNDGGLYVELSPEDGKLCSIQRNSEQFPTVRAEPAGAFGDVPSAIQQVQGERNKPEVPPIVS